jgi:hypothetical protein
MSKRSRPIDLAEVFREAGAIALYEAIFGGVPFAEDIDWIVELRRPDRGQESRLQESSINRSHASASAPISRASAAKLMNVSERSVNSAAAV